MKKIRLEVGRTSKHGGLHKKLHQARLGSVAVWSTARLARAQPWTSFKVRRGSRTFLDVGGADYARAGEERFPASLMSDYGKSKAVFSIFSAQFCAATYWATGVVGRRQGFAKIG